MEAQTIYGICHGAYSDWTVSLLCETREQAEKAIADMGADYDIEEFRYFPKGSGPGVHRIYRARGIEGSMEVGVESWRQFGEAPLRPEVRQDPWRGNQSAHPIYVEASCRDGNAAVKAVKDRLAALKAAGDWMSVNPHDAELLGLGREHSHS